MDIILQILMMCVGFALLITGADKFVEGASGVATKFKIPQIIIGLTIVAMGTSAPEAAVSISGALSGSPELSIGNAIGSNIMNILFILGVVGCIIPLTVSKEVVHRDIPSMIAVTVLLFCICRKGSVDRVDGIILIIAFILYLLTLIKSALANKQNEEKEESTETRSIGRLLILSFFGMCAIICGSKITVSSATEIATVLGVSERVIGLTVIAFGTSLPELVTSIIAARKGNADIAIGNIVGSNIFNILLILGLSASICPLPVATGFVTDGVVAIFATVLLAICIYADKLLSRAEAMIFLVCYGVYFVTLL